MLLSLPTPVVVPQTIAPNDARISATDCATVSATSVRLRITRPLVDGQGFENANPGARVRFQVTMAAAGVVTLKLRYTALVTRIDVYNDLGTVLIDGVAAATTIACQPRGSATPARVGFAVAAGLHTIEYVMPYCAAIDFEGAEVPPSSTVASASARPTKLIVGFGDSRVHGFNTSDVTKSWLWLMGITKGCRVLNLGYGGRAVVATDASLAGVYRADAAIYLCDFNNFYPGGQSLSTFQSAFGGLVANYRIAATAAGKPASRLYAMTSIDAPSAYGAGIYAANSPTLEAFRGAERAAVAAAGDTYATIIEGLGIGMPIGLANFADGIHPNDAASVAIASTVGGQVLI